MISNLMHQKQQLCTVYICMYCMYIYINITWSFIFPFSCCVSGAYTILFATCSKTHTFATRLSCVLTVSFYCRCTRAFSTVSEYEVLCWNDVQSLTYHDQQYIEIKFIAFFFFVQDEKLNYKKNIFFNWLFWN